MPLQVATSILNNGRFGMGAGSAGGIKLIIKAAGAYANQRIQFGRPIADFGLIQAKFAAMAADACECGCGCVWVAPPAHPFARSLSTLPLLLLCHRRH